MVTNTLAERMLLWGQLKIQLLNLEEEIKVTVLDLKATQVAGKVKASYSEGRGSYDWEEIAQETGADEMVVAKHTAPTTNWKKVCDEIGVPEQIMRSHFSLGRPSVSLKIEAK